MIQLATTSDYHKRLYNRALLLAIITILYNLVEGIVSTYFGYQDEALTLFGFGLDSFIETISAIGITHMIIRIKKYPTSTKDSFEILALKITGWCFYILAIILTFSAIHNIIEGQKPTSTTAGVIIAAISIFTMWLLIKVKLSVGKKLDSAAIIADAKCNQVCLYMSVLLLVSSALWMLFKVPYIDAIGSLGLVYFSVKEGKESFDKAKGIEKCGCH
jgi:divalent metal cation (Fe/Co/Zn/Cd) transporter